MPDDPAYSGRSSASTCSRAVLHSKQSVVTGRAIRRLKPIGSRALLAFVDLAGLQAPHRLLDLAEQERLAVVEAELGRVDLLFGRLVHRITADPIAVAVHRELEACVRVIGEASEVRLQASTELVGLLCRQHGFKSTDVAWTRQSNVPRLAIDSS